MSEILHGDDSDDEISDEEEEDPAEEEPIQAQQHNESNGPFTYCKVDVHWPDNGPATYINFFVVETTKSKGATIKLQPDGLYGLREVTEYRFELSDNAVVLNDGAGWFFDTELDSENQSVKVYHRGKFQPWTMCGLLNIQVKRNGGVVGYCQVNVYAHKVDKDLVVEYIASKAMELLYKANNNYSEIFTTAEKQSKDSPLYMHLERCLALIEDSQFYNAIESVLENPYSSVIFETHQVNLDCVMEMNHDIVYQILSCNDSNAFKLPNNHAWRNLGLDTVPRQVYIPQPNTTMKTVENGFVKMFLQRLREEIQKTTALSMPRVIQSLNCLNEWLSHPTMDNVDSIDESEIPHQSSILQYDPIYRDIYTFWFRFSETIVPYLSPIICDDWTFGCNRINMDLLWERYCFLQLVQAFNNICHQNERVQTDCFWDKAEIRKTALTYTYSRSNKPLVKIELRLMVDYPRVVGERLHHKPDFTVEFTSGASESSLIQFDAKYKRRETRGGIFAKWDDFRKMHVYRDGIRDGMRKTDGSYILFPGPAKGGQMFNNAGSGSLRGIGSFGLEPFKLNGEADLHI
jgi:hypothetical protein